LSPKKTVRQMIYVFRLHHRYVIYFLIFYSNGCRFALNEREYHFVIGIAMIIDGRGNILTNRANTSHA